MNKKERPRAFRLKLIVVVFSPVILGILKIIEIVIIPVVKILFVAEIGGIIRIGFRLSMPDAVSV